MTTVTAWGGWSSPTILLKVYAHYIPAHGAAELAKMACYLPRATSSAD